MATARGGAESAVGGVGMAEAENALCGAGRGLCEAAGGLHMLINRKKGVPSTISAITPTGLPWLDRAGRSRWRTRELRLSTECCRLFRLFMAG